MKENEYCEIEQDFDSFATQTDDLRESNGASKFEGTVGGLLGLHLKITFGKIFSLGFAAPWLLCFRERYLAERTYINGRKLRFDGRGGELFRKYMLWRFLTTITFGIYSPVFERNLYAWCAQHTHFEDTVDGVSEFDGRIGEMFEVHIITTFLRLCTLGIGVPWAICKSNRYRFDHCIIDGCRLSFKGKGGNLSKKFFIWRLLRIVTFNIYSLWRRLRYQQWLVENIEIDDCVNVNGRKRNVDDIKVKNKPSKPKKERKKVSKSVLIFLSIFLVRFLNVLVWETYQIFEKSSDGEPITMASVLVSSFFIIVQLALLVWSFIVAKKEKRKSMLFLSGGFILFLTCDNLILGNGLVKMFLYSISGNTSIFETAIMIFSAIQVIVCIAFIVLLICSAVAAIKEKRILMPILVILFSVILLCSSILLVIFSY